MQPTEPPQWEYEVLAILPAEAVKRVWGKAYSRFISGLLSTWRGWVFAFLVTLLALAILVVVWEVAGVFGWGLLGRLGAEFVVHLVLGYQLHPLMNRKLRILVRPYLQVELFEFVREELIPFNPCGPKNIYGYS